MFETMSAATLTKRNNQEAFQCKMILLEFVAAFVIIDTLRLVQAEFIRNPQNSRFTSDLNIHKAVNIHRVCTPLSKKHAL